MYLLVDPFVLCAPRPTEQAEMDDFVRYIVDWGDSLADDRNTFYITQECDYALCQHPLDFLRFRPHDIKSDIYDSITISNAATQITNYLLKPNYFLKIANLPILWVFCEDLNLNPDLVTRTRDEFIKRISEVDELTPEVADTVQRAAESLQEALGYIAYAKEICQHPILSKLLLLTYPINENSDTVVINAILETGGGALPPVETDLPIVKSPEDLLRHTDLTEIWGNTRSAINRAVVLHKANKTIDPDAQLSSYAVHPGFNQSLQECQFPTHSDRLTQCFGKIAQLLTGGIQNKNELRTAAPPTAPQREEKVNGRDWKAWRLQIMRGGEAYRLHYWHSDGEYVLSNVVARNAAVRINPINENIVRSLK